MQIRLELGRAFCTLYPVFPTAARCMGVATRILIVEDHEDTAAVFSALLARRGYEVHVAANAQDAKASASSQPFDLLLCDLSLPDDDGFHLLREIQAICEVEAIAVTAHGFTTDVAKTKAAGFRSHVLKPVAIEKLVQEIEEAMACRRARLDPPGASETPIGGLPA